MNDEMTAEMIEWTLELLAWIREEIREGWPEASLRGSAPELGPDGYNIRFRVQEDEYWMSIHADVIRTIDIAKVTALLAGEGWIGHLLEKGCIHVGMRGKGNGAPVFHPCPYLAGR